MVLVESFFSRFFKNFLFPSPSLALSRHLTNVILLPINWNLLLRRNKMSCSLTDLPLFAIFQRAAAVVPRNNYIIYLMCIECVTMLSYAKHDDGIKTFDKTAGINNDCKAAQISMTQKHHLPDPTK